ncbi:MAG TPA: DUF5666 domain-containing protein [Candidatus Limnocylindrales bacterium]|nr:DUF5666 domain-containing protein [Candidatus Limnocylindrales bacterium]
MIRKLGILTLVLVVTVTWIGISYAQQPSSQSSNPAGQTSQPSAQPGQQPEMKSGTATGEKATTPRQKKKSTGLEKVYGTVKEVSGNTLTLTPAKGKSATTPEPISITLTDKTKVRGGSTADLKAGEQVTVWYKEEGGSKVAQTVKIRRTTGSKKSTSSKKATSMKKA